MEPDLQQDKRCSCDGKCDDRCLCKGRCSGRCQCQCCSAALRPRTSSGPGTVYGLGFIGAVIYYIQHAATFGAGVLGFLKAIIWPVLMVYHLLGFLKM